MNLLRLAWNNLKIRPLNTFLSIVLLTFGAGIISLLLLAGKQLTDQFNRNIKDIDMVLGYKGSPMQLILANVYHVDAPTGNIKVSEAQRIIRNPAVKKAIPLAYGDNYEKFRIVGTTADYPAHYGIEVREGQAFSGAFEATIGSTVARQSGLKVGDFFESVHGLDEESEEGEEGHSHDHPYKVVGIYGESGTAIDHLILTSVQSVWDIHDHGHEENTAPDSLHTEAGDGMEVKSEHKEKEREMTAYLIIKRSPMAQIVLPSLARGTDMQLAIPAIEVNRLSQNFGLGMDTMTAIAGLIMLLSFISVFVSLFNSLKERRYELALMRAMGGGALRLFSMIIIEGLLLSVIGFALGVLVSRAGLYWLSERLSDSFHYSLNDWAIQPEEWVLFGVTLIIGFVASFLPAWKAFRMDISKTLSNG